MAAARTEREAEVPDPGGPSRAGADEVDRVVSAWGRERPDVDPSSLEVLSRIDRLATFLARARADAFGTAGLSAWEFDVLAALRRSGEPFELSPGALLTRTMVTSGTMTTRVDRLSDRRLVRRRADPDDRRGVLVVLTPAGRRSVDSALDALLEHERRLLAPLTVRDRDRLATLLRRLLVAVEDG